MKILSLAPTSFFNDYGCHVRILEEARALMALGHDVTVLTYYKGKAAPGVRIIRTMPTPWRPEYEVGSSRHKFAFDALLAIRLVRVLARAALERKRFDLIHAHLHEGALIGGVIGRLFGVPVCFDFQGSLTDEMVMHRFVTPGSWAQRLFTRVERLANALPDAIVTSTRNAAEMLRGTVRGPVEALPDGVNTTFCRPDVIDAATRAALRGHYGIGPDEPVAVFLGLLAQHQGIQCIIEAAVHLKARGATPQVKWMVMGYPNEHIWRDMAAAAGVADAMVFTGRVPYNDMPRMLAMGDIAVAPKLSLTDGSGKILNYIAMRLPTVAFDTVAQREILGSLGVFVPPGDSAAMAECVQELARAPERRVELGEQLRRRVKQTFSWERAALTLESIYRQIVRHPVNPVAPVTPVTPPAEDR